MSPSSRATTPSTPLLSLKSAQAAGSSADTVYVNADLADRSFSGDRTHDIIKIYLQFVSGFIKDRVKGCGESNHAKGNASLFLKVCQLLVLLASYGSDKEIPVDQRGM